MTNKIIERFSEKAQKELHDGLLERKKIMVTTNKRLAPNSIVSTDNIYTVGINPTDESYYDREIKRITDLISKDDLKMIKKFTNTYGEEAGKRAFNDSFELVREQYNFEDVLRLLDVYCI